jgi:hypothetical protein
MYAGTMSKRAFTLPVELVRDERDGRAVFDVFTTGEIAVVHVKCADITLFVTPDDLCEDDHEPMTRARLRKAVGLDVEQPEELAL